MTADDKARTEGLRIARLFANGQGSEYLSMERNGVLNLAAEITAALASAEQAGRDKGLEEAAGLVDTVMVRDADGKIWALNNREEVAAAIRARKETKS